jgi:hypothetical protein
MPQQQIPQQDIQAIVAAVLAEQSRLHKEQIDDVVLKTVVNLLTSFGFEEDERKELRADFRHLRKWRMSVESAEGLTVKVVVGTIVSGFVAAVWLGFKVFVGK